MGVTLGELDWTCEVMRLEEEKKQEPEGGGWSAQFLERRMREHREWQERESERMALEIVEEVAACMEIPRRA